MPLPPLVKTLIEQKLSAFFRKRVPPHIADKIRLAYAIRDGSVTIFEQRPPVDAGSH